jgi:hypothetical protein
MKRIISICAALFITAIMFAQAPEKMSYQAVIRNSSDALVTNTQIGIEINIRQGSPTGTIVYSETQTPTTNANGLVSIEIGGGAGFSTIDWANGLYFIETNTAIVPPLTTYTITGTSQLLSVPYAIHAKTAETVTGGINEIDPIFGASVASGITVTDTTNWNNKLDSYTETDPVFVASVACGITETDTTNWNNKLDSYTETDPIFGTSVASGITVTDTTNWNNKLDSYTETDPIFGTSVASGITETDTTNWNNKLDSYTETDPVFVASVASGITETDTTNWNNKLDSYTETDPKIGANTSGFSPKWDGTNLVTGSVFQDASGNVGIGTTTPGSVLDLSGGFLRIHTSNVVPTGNVDGLEMGYFTAGGYAFLQGYNRGTNTFLPIEFSGSTVGFRTDGNTVMNILSNGNVGIGTILPTTKLDVNGVIKATGGNSTQWNESYSWGNHATAGYLTSFTEIDPKIGANTNGFSPKWDGASLVTGAVFQDASGNVGIGTSTPTTNLEVNGDVKITGNFYAPGTVVQMIVNTSETISSLNVTEYTEASTDYRIDFTPKFSNSIILIEYTFPINAYMASNTNFDMQIIRDIGGTEVPVGIGPVNGNRRQVSYVGRPGNGFDWNDRNQVYMTAKDNGLTTGNTYTYGFKFRRESGGSGTCYFNHSFGDSDVYGFSGVMTMKITEIAQ